MPASKCGLLSAFRTDFSLFSSAVGSLSVVDELFRHRESRQNVPKMLVTRVGMSTDDFKTELHSDLLSQSTRFMASAVFWGCRAVVETNRTTLYFSRR